MEGDGVGGDVKLSVPLCHRAGIEPLMRDVQALKDGAGLPDALFRGRGQPEHAGFSEASLLLFGAEEVRPLAESLLRHDGIYFVRTVGAANNSRLARGTGVFISGSRLIQQCDAVARSGKGQRCP